MSKQFLVLLLSIIFFTACSEKGKTSQINKSDKKSRAKIVAYVHGWKDNWGENNEKATQITHINYAFANIKDGKVIEGKEADKEALEKLNELKLVNKELKILISVGGWSWSKNFSDAVLTPNTRQVFANSAIDFMLRHQIDGIDLDWEYPGLIGDNNVFRPEDKENFTAILKLLREKLDSIGSNKKSYLLTIATAASQTYLDHTDMKEAHQYLDFINIMTYDFFVGGNGKTGHHANLYHSSDKDGNSRSGNRAVQEHIIAGIPTEKLLLGVPFYGRWWTGTNPKNRGLYQEATGKYGSYSYITIADSLRDNVFDSYWDESAMVPYIWRKKDSLFMTYDDEISIKHKAEYINNKGLGGIMFWQFNGDNGDLLNSISDNLK